MIEAVLTFPYDTAQTARQVAQSLTPEVGAVDDDRSRVQLDRTDRTVELRIAATDQTALRASLNSWLRLVTAAEQAGSA